MGYLIFLLMVVDILKVVVSVFLGFIICVLAAQSCSALCNSMDCRPPGFSVHGILQARILECVAIPSSGDLPDPGMEPSSLMSPALAGGLLTTNAT